LAPFFSKGSPAEWVMLGFHLLFPLLLLLIFWRGRMKQALSLREDLPIFAVILLFHAADILFTLAGGYVEVLGLVVLSSLVHWALLGWIWWAGKKLTARGGSSGEAGS
jgi:hypothetical protein